MEEVKISVIAILCSFIIPRLSQELKSSVPSYFLIFDYWPLL